MGAINFSLSPVLVTALQEVLPLDVLVETGTFKGDSVAGLLDRFREIHTVELSKPYYEEAVARFKAEAHVHVAFGHSPDYLRSLQTSRPRRATLFFLDAHWCVAADTAGATSQCPLLDEIDAVGQLDDHSVIVIDDARLFLAPPPDPHETADWPAFDQVLHALQRNSATHELMVLNDTIVFYPPLARAALNRHAKRHGVDWLHIHQTAMRAEALAESEAAKEQVIQTQHLTILEVQQREARMATMLADHQGASAGPPGAVGGDTANGAPYDHDWLADQLSRSAEMLQIQHALVLELKAGQQALASSISAIQLEQAHHAHYTLIADTNARQQATARAVELRETQQALARNIGATQAELARSFELSQAKHALLIDSALAAAPAREPLPAYQTPEVHALILKALDDKEKVIQELQAAVTAYRSAFGVFGMFARPMAHLAPAFSLRRFVPRPKLGTLYQHPPRDLTLPRSYSRSAQLAHEQAPKISLVTPSFRQAAFIERTLRSVLDQNYSNLEYFVQDGGSQDGTTEVLARYEDRLTGWASAPDGGQSQAINLGFQKTSGDIMGWLNSDDLLLPDTLNYVASYFANNPSIDVVYGHRVLIDESDRVIGRWILPGHSDEVLSWADYIPQETLFWRRSIWEKTGGKIDESFKFAMDWDLLLRFRSAGAKFSRINRVMGAFRIHSSQKTSAEISQTGFKEMDRLRERALGHIPNYSEIRRAILPYLIRHIAHDIKWSVLHAK